MNYQRKTLLADRGAGFGRGNEPGFGARSPKDQGSQSKPPHATQQMNQAPGAKTGQSAQQPNRGTNGPAEQNAAQGEHNGKAAQQQNERNGKAGNQQNEHNGTAAQQQNQGGRDNNAAAQRERNGMQGLQGNATGMHAQLTDEQRTRIRNTVIRAEGAPRVAHIDFDVTVGTVVPRDRIRVIPVPETLVQIEPEWRGLLYFVYEDEVVIVDPNDMRIVAVVPA